jgi:predicted transcriptional regulator
MASKLTENYRLDRVKLIAQQKKVELKEIARAVGITPQGLSKQISTNSKPNVFKPKKLKRLILNKK